MLPFKSSTIVLEEIDSTPNRLSLDLDTRRKPTPLTDDLLLQRMRAEGPHFKSVSKPLEVYHRTLVQLIVQSSLYLYPRLAFRAANTSEVAKELSNRFYPTETGCTALQFTTSRSSTRPDLI